MITRFERFIQYFKDLPDRWTRKLDQYLLLHYPALWAHGYSKIFESLLKEALPAYGGLLILAIILLFLGGGGIAVGLIILFLGIPFLGLWTWLGEMLTKREQEIYGRVTQLGLGDLYYSVKEELAHRWLNFSLVTLTQFHPFLIFCTLLVAISSLFNLSNPRKSKSTIEVLPALILLDHRLVPLDSAVTGFVQNEYQYYIFEKGMPDDQAFHLVYDSLRTHADSLNLRISDTTRIKDVIKTSWEDTSFLHHYRIFFASKEITSIVLDTIWQRKHYLPRQTWYQFTNKIDRFFNQNSLLGDIGTAALILLLFFYRYILSLILRDRYYIDLILLHIRIPKTFLSGIGSKSVNWLAWLGFICVVITVLDHIFPGNDLLENLSGYVVGLFSIIRGNLSTILLWYLGFLTTCTFINYFVLFPKIRRRIMAERACPGDIPYYEVKPLKNKMKIWTEKVSNYKIQFAYNKYIKEKIRELSTGLLPLNPELWRRGAIRFTYELWFFMSAGFVLLLFLFGLVQLFLKANGLSENWIYDYLALAGTLLWILPFLLAFFLYLTKIVQNPAECLLPHKFDRSFNLKYEIGVGAWLSLLVGSLFFYRKIGMYIFGVLISISSGQDTTLGEMNSNVGVIHVSEFWKRRAMNWNLHSVTFGEYWYLTNHDRLDSLSAVKNISDSILLKLDDRYWMDEDKVINLWRFKNQDSNIIRQNYLSVLNLPPEDSINGFAALNEARKNKAHIIGMLNQRQLLEGHHNVITGDYFHLFFLFLLASILYFEEVIMKEMAVKIRKHFRKYWFGISVFAALFIFAPLVGLALEKLEILKLEGPVQQLYYGPAYLLGDLLDKIFSLMNLPVMGILGVLWLVYLLPRIKQVIYRDFYEPE